MKWGGNPYSNVRRATFEGISFRSQAEASVARYFARVGLEWEYEPREFEFPVKRGTRFYKPDFRVTENGGYRWIEVKGWFDKRSMTRLARFGRYFPDEAARLDVYTDAQEAPSWVAEHLPPGARVLPLRKLVKSVR